MAKENQLQNFKLNVCLCWAFKHLEQPDIEHLFHLSSQHSFQTKTIVQFDLSQHLLLIITGQLTLSIYYRIEQPQVQRSQLKQYRTTFNAWNVVGLLEMADPIQRLKLITTMPTKLLVIKQDTFLSQILLDRIERKNTELLERLTQYKKYVWAQDKSRLYSANNKIPDLMSIDFKFIKKRNTQYSQTKEERKNHGTAMLKILNDYKQQKRKPLVRSKKKIFSKPQKRPQQTVKQRSYFSAIKPGPTYRQRKQLYASLCKFKNPQLRALRKSLIQERRLDKI